MSRAEHQETPDSHDLGKLNKWHEGLPSQPSDDFPVCALFLASGEDIRAHNIFRIFRNAFEELGGGFHNLVIFGQHGMSSSVSELIPGLGLTDVQTPSLVLISDDSGLVFHTTSLPSGELADGESEEDNERTPWRIGLDAIQKSVEQKRALILDDVPGLERNDFSDGTLVETLGRVKLRVEEKSPG